MIQNLGDHLWIRTDVTISLQYDTKHRRSSEDLYMDGVTLIHDKYNNREIMYGLVRMLSLYSMTDTINKRLSMDWDGHGHFP